MPQEPEANEASGEVQVSNSMFEAKIHEAIGRFQTRMGRMLDAGLGFDWATIITLIAQVLVPLLQNCQNKSGKRLKKMGLVDRARLRLAVREAVIMNDDLPESRAIRPYVKELSESLEDAARESSVDELDAMLAEVNE